MRPRFRTALTIAGVAVALGLAVAVGYLAASSIPSPGTADAPTASSGAVKDSGLLGAPDTVTGSSGYGEAAVGDQAARAPVSPDASDRLVVMTAAIAVRVDDLDNSVTAVRRIATASGSQISNLSIYTGDPEPSPVPLADQGTISQTTGPATAAITLRVPADKLESVEEQVADLGTVLTQSSAEDDVTQEHVDLAARLKNLRAEETRLRSFLDKATKVSEMLEVERELARVRGEIESMQAQLAYLERQAAMATLTISLSEPGPVVSPGTQGWGLGEAVTRGVRIASALLGATITLLVAGILPLLMVAVFILIRRMVRRRHRSEDADSTMPAE